VASWATPEPSRPVPLPVVAQPEMPPTYCVRDGDDLTAIARRFYGHPGAADSLWAANRDVIPDPNVLPIGAELRLPPPWSVQGVPATAHGVGRAIEPPRTVAVPPVPVQPPSMSATGWLDPRQSRDTPPLPPRPPAAGPTVRVAPGDTLESIAARFYGDRAAATRIWDANRDRLRSPELVVVGMELRLP
jgi:nucleoid-associated protein YgaU